jgi:hypothetical protein
MALQIVLMPVMVSEPTFAESAGWSRLQTIWSALGPQKASRRLIAKQ